MGFSERRNVQVADRRRAENAREFQDIQAPGWYLSISSPDQQTRAGLLLLQRTAPRAADGVIVTHLPTRGADLVAGENKTQQQTRGKMGVWIDT